MDKLRDMRNIICDFAIVAAIILFCGRRSAHSYTPPTAYLLSITRGYVFYGVRTWCSWHESLTKMGCPANDQLGHGPPTLANCLLPSGPKQRRFGRNQLHGHRMVLLKIMQSSRLPWPANPASKF